MDQFTFVQTFLLVATGIGGLLVAIVAIRISLNWVDFLEYRRKIKLGKLQNLCPHATVTKVSGSFAVASRFYSPAGTLDYVCSQCQLVRHDVDMEMGEYWAANPLELMKREKKFQKAVRKFYKM